MASIYDAVKAELGDGPKYASRPDFKTYFGYAKGTSLGEFPTLDAAKQAGATTTEPNFDEAGFRAAQAAYSAHQQAITDEWFKRIRADYPEVNDAVFNSVYSMAYDRGHSSGYGEVENYISDYVEFAVKVIAASKAA